MKFPFIMSCVFPISVLIVLAGILIDQIRLAGKIRRLEMNVYNRSPAEQEEIDQANYYE